MGSRSRALVTGAEGFTGRHLLAHLDACGLDIVALTHAAPTVPGGVRADLTDRDAVLRAVAAAAPDYVFHLAGIAFVAHADLESFYRVNVFGTLNLLDALVEAGAPVRKVVLTSSANVYGNPPMEVVDETCRPAPVNHYACSKLAMEHMARTYDDQLPIVLARPFNYTGPGQSEQFLIPKIVGHFARGARTIELGNLDVTRDFSDVGRVVAAYERLARSEAVADTVNVCSGIGTSLLEVIDAMNAIAGYSIDVRVNPAFVRANEIKRLIGDPSKLSRLAGNLPQPTLSQTLQRMYRSMRQSQGVGGA